MMFRDRLSISLNACRRKIKAVVSVTVFGSHDMRNAQK